MAGQFRYTVWDPVMIISQIVTLQSVFYVCLGECSGVYIFMKNHLFLFFENWGKLIIFRVISFFPKHKESFIPPPPVEFLKINTPLNNAILIQLLVKSVVTSRLRDRNRTSLLPINF